MKGNFHVRFLGGSGLATAPGYPTVKICEVAWFAILRCVPLHSYTIVLSYGYTTTVVALPHVACHVDNGILVPVVLVDVTVTY